VAAAARQPHRQPVDDRRRGLHRLRLPAEYYGDVFYLLRQSARIYRLDLQPPCFMPDPNGITPLAFHDSTDDNDFNVISDFDGDGEFDEGQFTNFMAIVQGPDPLGRQVLYVAAKRGTATRSSITA
jgi:hypothetical protein